MKDIIVVTGASSGMGREFVRQIEGKEKVDEIWVIARREDRLNELKNEINTTIVPLPMDLTVPEEIKKYEQKLAEEKPNIKILVNSSGYAKINHYENIPLETHLNMVDLNCKAVMTMINYSLPYMDKGAKIVNIASCAGFQPIPYLNVYAATKSFVLSYSRSLNMELKYREISVTAVCPLWTATEFFERAVKHDEKPVVIKYNVIYNAKDVIEKAIKDTYKRKDVSVYGATTEFQRLAVKIMPHKFVMKVFMKQQKLDGTKQIRP